MSNSNNTKEWQKLYGDIVSEKVATKVTLPKPPEFSRKSVLDDGWDNHFAGTENFTTYNNQKS
jgi:hypothetical protein|tara:strand:+ start:532 stop:720 length:189 start_codon:yes stop_codon:yes gene_type:complete